MYNITHSVCTLAVCSVLWLFVSWVMSLRRARKIKIYSHEVCLLLMSYSTCIAVPKIEKLACLVLAWLFLSDEVSRGQLQHCHASVHFHCSVKQWTLTAEFYINTVQCYQDSQRYKDTIIKVMIFTTELLTSEIWLVRIWLVIFYNCMSAPDNLRLIINKLKTCYLTNKNL